MPNIEPKILLKARGDLAQRLGLDEDEVTEAVVEQTEFPDAALGAPVEDEMSAQVITPGWCIRYKAGSNIYEYRATERQLRLVNFKGRNFRL